tara:strand:+ start:69851 stop:69979 length:129 start_codon:yes stop_codon:yes gene_type:complete
MAAAKAAIAANAERFAPSVIIVFSLAREAVLAQYIAVMPQAG